MTLLIAGLALFAATHIFSRWRSMRAQAIERLGEIGYKSAFSLVATAALVLLIVGYRSADFIDLYEPLPPKTARGVARALMPFAFILAAGAVLPSNLKRYVANPLTFAVLIWTVVHLSANGDVASVLLFGGLLIYALINLYLSFSAPAAPPPPPRARSRDLVLILIGLAGYGLAMWVHGAVFGVYVAA